MKVRRIFTTEMDLEVKVSRRFRRRLLRLYERHMRRAKNAKRGVDMLKAACVAWAFVCAVEDGGAALARDFEGMMHGECANFIEMDDRLLVLGDDDYAQEAFIWDATHLLLEEHGEEELERLQPVYDVVDLHVRDAYDVENEDEVLLEEYVGEDCCVVTEETVLKMDVCGDEVLRRCYKGIARSLMLDEDYVTGKIKVMRALGMNDIVQWLMMLDNMYKNEKEKNKEMKMDNQGLNCKTYVAAGAMNIENIEHVENLFPGSREMIESILSAKKKEEATERKDAEVLSADDKLMSKLGAAVITPLDRFYAGIRYVKESGIAKHDYEYAAVKFRIDSFHLFEKLSNNSFVSMLMESGAFTEEDCPKADNIKKVMIEGEYPNWRLLGKSCDSLSQLFNVVKKFDEGCKSIG